MVDSPWAFGDEGGGATEGWDWGWRRPEVDREECGGIQSRLYSDSCTVVIA